MDNDVHHMKLTALLRTSRGKLKLLDEFITSCGYIEDLDAMLIVAKHLGAMQIELQKLRRERERNERNSPHP